MELAYVEQFVLAVLTVSVLRHVEHRISGRYRTVASSLSSDGTAESD